LDQLTLKNLGVKGGRKGLLLRFDLPTVTVHAGDDTDTGLGDLYGQALFFPRLNRFALGVGTGLFVPTASLDTTGTGKWSVAPLVAPLWFFPQRAGFAYVKIQDVLSFAGEGNRPDLHYLLVTPTLVKRTGRRSWLLLDSEGVFDWKNDRRGYKSGLQLGSYFHGPNGAWIKVEIPWGPDQQADWILKASFLRYEK
jgi:hypothetical protein